ncbi:uncharacterized protein LOC129609154 [Condylostylus longicornis]|uniref:uncharacterized protein LOC129609154 n=1 Tax=Condylostylus longicornis TaxID=2530218 RepID=UPI00244D99E5|nr:uncharacterized protein LOC129609154 [Condylostylus longicornis]
MSLGALCVIVIPTEAEELKLQQQQKGNEKNNFIPTTATYLSTSSSAGTLTTSSNPISLNKDKDNLNTKYNNDNLLINKNKIGSNYENQNESSKENSTLSLDKNSKITGIDNNSFEIEMDYTINNLQNRINRSADDLKNIQKEVTIKDSNSDQSSKKKLNSSSLYLDLVTESSMVTVLKEIFRKLRIENISWNKIRDNRYYQIMFTIDCDHKYENLQLMLNDWGIGYRKGSEVTFANCTFNSYRHDDEDRKYSTTSEDYTATKSGVWNRFMNNLAARLNIAQVVRDVRQDATITFDFTILVISAAVLASFGLVENSTIFLTSSMLISPLMGPIIAGIFGTVIKDGPLTLLGVKNELIGLLMATLVGFVFGLIVCLAETEYNILDDGLTIEMISRTSLHSICVGIITATVSGAAAAVGILGGNVGSLVGVAISASLLPPAVNAGLLWALSCIYISHVPDESSKIHTQMGVYSDNIATELGILGFMSLLLTVSNIICVYVIGVVILKIKEIAPISIDKQFWRHDIRIARDYNKHPFNDDSSLPDEYSQLPKEEQNVIKRLNSLKLDDLAHPNTWSPVNLQNLPFNKNLQDLERYYSTTVHSSRYSGGGRANSLCAEKIRHQLDDFSNYVRRSSMPFEVLTRSPKTKRSIKRLPTIEASPYETSAPSTLEKSNNSKFTITPVLDYRKIDHN